MLLHLIGWLSLVPYIVLCRQILIVANNLNLLLLSSTSRSGITPAVINFCSFLAWILGVSGWGHLHSTLEYSLLIVRGIVGASRSDCAGPTHIIGTDVATFAALTLIMAIFCACLGLEMLASHLLPNHLILWTARLVNLSMLTAPAPMNLLRSIGSIAMMLFPFVLAAALNRNSRLWLHLNYLIKLFFTTTL